MHQEIDKEYSPSELYQKRVVEQLNRLRHTLEKSMFDKVSKANYMERVKFETWHQSENDRIHPWLEEKCSEGSSQPKSEVLMKLLSILNGPAPSKQAAINLFNELKDELTIDMLMQIVSETRAIAVSDSMKSITKNKVNATNEKMQEFGIRWLEYQAGMVDGTKHTKNTAALPLSKEFFMKEKNTRNRYLRNIENNDRIFPDGIEAAKRRLGII